MVKVFISFGDRIVINIVFKLYCEQRKFHSQNETTLKLFDDFKEKNTLQLPSTIREVFTGECIGVNILNECIVFYDWENQSLIRRIDGMVLVSEE